ncbi:MAG: hypothetical protein LIP08_00355 [Bacteroides sp.]|nr:hypothetical protein [Bacteroides sp.]
MFGEGTSVADQPYRYGMKELDDTQDMNTYDFSARFLHSSLNRFTTMDPLAEKYYEWTPYAYGANNPLRYMDLNGDSLILIGSRSDLEATINVYNNALGGFYTTSIDAGSRVNISQVSGTDLNNMTSQQSHYYNALNQIISDNGITTINVVNSTPDVIGTAATATVDIADIQALGDGAYINQSSALLHQTWEQYAIQVKGQNVTKAHLNAAAVENLVTGSRPDPLHRYLQNGCLSVSILDSSGNILRTVIIQVNTMGNVTGITR